MIRLLLTLFYIVLISACTDEHTADAIDHSLQTPAIHIGSHAPLNNNETNPKEIVVVTHAGPNSYYINADNHYAGIEYDLVRLFNKQYAPDYRIKFMVVSKESDVLPALLSGKADIAAANLAITPARKEHFKFTIPYRKTQQQLVYNKVLNSKPRNLNSIADKRVIVPANSSYSERLQAINAKHSSLHWQADANMNNEELLSKVAAGEVDFTIADNQLVNLMRNYYPNLSKALPIGMPEQIAWAFSPQADSALQVRVNAFFKTIKKNGELRNLLDRYYGHTERLKENDVQYFLARIESTLPKYKRLFKQAAKETGINWRLLAALSFRESHWDPTNTSPTKVRGIMMLTESTAKSLGVKNRLDPKEAIPAGARYIAQLKEKFSSDIPEQDRTYMALASYNIGYAHVLDARKLARRLNLNPDSWADLKKTLIMLSNPKYYSTLRYGYASGGAPIIFVETIRSYHRILEKYHPSRIQVQSEYFVAAR